MNYNTDGFNERTVYIHNSNDKNRLNDDAIHDSSFAKMKIDENKPDMQTANSEKIYKEDVKISTNNHNVLKNFNILNPNRNINNRVNDALNKNNIIRNRNS